MSNENSEREDNIAMDEGVPYDKVVAEESLKAEEPPKVVEVKEEAPQVEAPPAATEAKEKSADAPPPIPIDFQKHLEEFEKRQAEAWEQREREWRARMEAERMEIEAARRPIIEAQRRREYEQKMSEARKRYEEALGSDFDDLPEKERTFRSLNAYMEHVAPLHPSIRFVMDFEAQQIANQARDYILNEIVRDVRAAGIKDDEIPMSVAESAREYFNSLSGISTREAAKKVGQFIISKVRESSSRPPAESPSPSAAPSSAAPPTRQKTEIEAQDEAYAQYLAKEEARRALYR